MKLRMSGSLRETISKLIRGRNKLNLRSAFEHLITDKVVIDLNLLCASIEHNICNKGTNTEIITPKYTSM